MHGGRIIQVEHSSDLVSLQGSGSVRCILSPHLTASHYHKLLPKTEHSIEEGSPRISSHEWSDLKRGFACADGAAAPVTIAEVIRVPTVKPENQPTCQEPRI